MIQSVKMTPPAAPTLAALQDSKSVIAAKLLGMSVIVVYCKTNQAGALWIPIPEKAGIGVWTSMSPVSIDEYLQALQAQEVTFDQGEDFERWVAYVTGQTTRTN